MTSKSRPIPFVGLRPFDIDDHHWFHGRDAEIAALRRKIRSNRFTAVIGAAGCGKSSLVRAGILPALVEGGCQPIVIKPGSSPIARLAAALSDSACNKTTCGSIKHPQAVPGTDHDHTKLRPSLLREISRQLASETQQLILVIDQFDELFRYGEEVRKTDKSASEKEKHAFVELLLTAVSQHTSRLHVIITMRTDFLNHCTAYAGLAEVLEAAQYLVQLPQRNQLEEIIRAPIAKAGGKIDEKLLQRILVDVAEQTDALPTLQHTLKRLWEVAQGDPRWLSEQNYYTIGGLANSIHVKAEQITSNLRRDHKEDFVTLECVMKSIAALDEQGRAIRRPQKRSTLLRLVTESLGDSKAANDSLSRVLNTLASEEISFVQLGDDDDVEVDIGHEVLIRSWRRLCGGSRQFITGWLVDEREDNRGWWNGMLRNKTRQLKQLGQAWHAKKWFNKRKDEPRYGDAWKTIQQFHRQSLIKGSVLSLTLLGAVNLLVIFGIVFVWTNHSGEQHQDVLHQTRTEAITIANHAQHYIETGHTRLGALIALSAIPKNHRIADSHSYDEIGVALTNAFARPIEIMRRDHDSLIYSVAFSPDGSLIVSSSADNTLRLWDASTVTPIGEPLHGHDGPVNTVAFSPDGSRMVSGSWDNTLRLWDIHTGTPIGEPLIGHHSYVISAAFSSDGSRIVSGSWDKTLRLWDANTGKAIGKPLRGHDSLVYSVAFSPDGSRIVSGSEDKTLRLWDASTGKAIGKPLRSHASGVNSVAFSPNGSRIVSGSDDNTLRLWDANNGTLLKTLLHGHSESVYSVAFSPDGNRIVSGSSDKTLRLWDVDSGKALGEPINGHDGPVDSVAFSPDGSRIVSGGSDKTLRLWLVNSNKEIGEPLIGHDSFVYSAAFSPDGNRIVSGGEDKMLRLWDANSGKAIVDPMISHDGPVNSVAFSPDGNRIVSGSSDKTLRLWNAMTGEPIGEPLHGHDHAVLSVAFSPDGKRIISGSADKTLRRWNANTGMAIGEPLQGHDDGVFSVAFSPDGNRIVSGSTDKTLRQWDANSGKKIGAPLHGHDSGVYSVAFSPDGSRIVSGSMDKTLRLWDANTGMAIGTFLHGHDDGVFSVAFSPDGTRIVSGSSDKTLRLWDAKTGAALGYPLHGHKGMVYSVNFSPDGSRIVSGNSDKALRLWDTRIFLTSLEYLIGMAEKLCPLTLTDHQQLRTSYQLADFNEEPLTLVQRRACEE